MKSMMSLIGVLLGVVLMFPAFAMGQTVTIDTDTDATVSLSLDAAAQATYARIKADPNFDAAIIKQLIEDWLTHHQSMYAKADGVDVHDRLEALSATDKAKVMDQLGLCESGSC